MRTLMFPANLLMTMGARSPAPLALRRLAATTRVAQEVTSGRMREASKKCCVTDDVGDGVEGVAVGPALDDLVAVELRPERRTAEQEIVHGNDRLAWLVRSLPVRSALNWSRKRA